jgi:hypothetical protein
MQPAIGRALLTSWVWLACTAGAAPVADDIKSPFVAHFEKDGVNLYYVAANHGLRGPTLELIDRIFKTRRLGLVILEGFEYRGIENQHAADGWAHTQCDADYCSHGAGGLAAKLAAQRGIAFMGGEPSLHDTLAALRKRGYGAKDLMGYYFVRWLPQYRREGRFDGVPLEELFARSDAERVGISAESGEPVLSLEGFKRWYLAKNGKPFTLAKFDGKVVSPDPDSRCFTQRISSAENEVRNRFVLDLLTRRLPLDRDILIIYGHSHYFQERDTLEKMLGRPTIER